MAATREEAEKSVATIQSCKKRVDDIIAKSSDGLSAETLEAFMESLGDVDKVVVDALISEQANLIKDPDVRGLVTEYFGASLETLEFLNELENCLRVLETSHTHMLLAIIKYEKGEYNACVESLKNFEATGDPFQEKFYPMFYNLHTRQTALLDQVTKMQDEVARKKQQAASSSWWGNLFGIVAAAATVVASLCAAVAVFFPPAGVVAGVAAAVAVASTLASAILNAKSEEERLRKQEELTNTILASTTSLIAELDNLHILATTLSMQIESLTGNAQLAILDPDALDLVIDPIKRQTTVFREDINQLTFRARDCKQIVFNGRDTVAALIRNFI